MQTIKFITQINNAATGEKSQVDYAGLLLGIRHDLFYFMIEKLSKMDIETYIHDDYSSDRMYFSTDTKTVEIYKTHIEIKDKKGKLIESMPIESYEMVLSIFN